MPKRFLKLIARLSIFLPIVFAGFGSFAALDELSANLRGTFSGVVNSYIHSLLEEKKGSLIYPISGYVELRNIVVTKSSTEISGAKSSVSFDFRFNSLETVQIIDPDFRESVYGCTAEWVGTLDKVVSGDVQIRCQHGDTSMVFYKMPSKIYFAIAIDGRYRVSGASFSEKMITHYLRGFPEQMTVAEFRNLDTRSPLEDIDQKSYTTWASNTPSLHLFRAIEDPEYREPISIKVLYDQLSNNPEEGQVHAVGECRIGISELREHRNNSSGAHRYYFGFGQSFDHNYNGNRRLRDLGVFGNFGPEIREDRSSFQDLFKKGRFVIVLYIYNSEISSIKLLEFDSPSLSVLKGTMHIDNPLYLGREQRKYEIRSCGYSPQTIEEFYNLINSRDLLNRSGNLGQR